VSARPFSSVTVQRSSRTAAPGFLPLRPRCWLVRCRQRIDQASVRCSRRQKSARARLLTQRVVSVLPSLLDDGAMMNLPYLQSQLSGFNYEAAWQVWLSPVAPRDAIERLKAEGLIVQSSADEETRVMHLARQGPALSLLLLLSSAVVGSLLAIGGTAISIAASARRRSYESAALGAVGVSRRQLFRAALYEQSILLGTAVVLGVAGGVFAAVLALPAIPEFATDTPVLLIYSPAPFPLALSTLGFVVFVLIAAAASAASVLRQARPSRLREAEE
jgi:putative ABC transport system permease protein